MHLKIMSYVSSAFWWTPGGRSGCMHWASLLLMRILLGMMGYFMWASSTLFSLVRAAIRSAHSEVFSNPLMARSTWVM